VNADDLVGKFWNHLGIAREDFDGTEVTSSFEFIGKSF
jgi:hypothetical protein